MKKKVIAGIIGVIAIVAITTGIAITNQKPKLTKDSITIEAGNEFKPEAKDFFSGKHVKDITFDAKDVDVDKVGEYKVSASYKKHSYEITVKVEDTTAPKVSAKTKDPVYTKDLTAIKPEDYVTVEDVSDATVSITGYQKLDSLDGNVSGDPTTETPEEEGFYKATITATDSSDNKSEAEVILVYDKTAPVIEGLQDTTVESDPTEDQFNPTANDNLDGQVDVTKTLEKTGDNQYTVTAKATDKAGNEATQTATITVVQPVAETPAQATTQKSNKGSSSSKGSSGGNGSASNNSSSSNGGGSNSTASSQQTQPSAPAQQETPTQQPEQNNSQPSSDSKVNEDGTLKNDEDIWDYVENSQVKPDTHKCIICGAEFGTDYDAYVAHMKNVHGI